LADVVPDLRARARPVDDPARAARDGHDPDDVWRAGAARQSSARLAGAPGGRFFRARGAPAADPGVDRSGLEHPVRRLLAPERNPCVLRKTHAKRALQRFFMAKTHLNGFDFGRGYTHFSPRFAA